MFCYNYIFIFYCCFSLYFWSVAKLSFYIFLFKSETSLDVAVK